MMLNGQAIPIQDFRVTFAKDKMFQAFDQLGEAMQQFARGMSAISGTFKTTFMDPQLKVIFKKLAGRERYSKRYRRIGARNENGQSHPHRRRR